MSSRKKARLSSPKSTPSKAALPSGTPPKVTYGINTPSQTLGRRSSAAPPQHLLRRAISSLIRSDEETAEPKEEKPQSRGVTEEKIVDGLSDLKKEKHCEVRLLKLDKVHLQEKATQGPTEKKVIQGPPEEKATQGPPGVGADEGLLLCENEGSSKEGLDKKTTRCDVKLARLDKDLLLSTKLPSVDIGRTIDQTKVTEVVDLTGDQGQDLTPWKKKSCVVRLAKLAMLDKIIKKEEGAEVQQRTVVGEVDVADHQDKEVSRSLEI